MKNIHVNCSFALESLGFYGCFNIESPVDIPIIDSLETLWDWMQYWKTDEPYFVACFFNIKEDGTIIYETYQLLTPTYVTYKDCGSVRSVLTPKTVKLINDTIVEHKDILGDKIMIIPRSDVHPQSDTLISPSKIINIPFSEVEQKIADIL